MAWAANPTSRRSALQEAARRPVQGFDPGFFARLNADMDAMMLFSNSDASFKARQTELQRFALEFSKESGQQMPGNFADGVFSYAAAEKQFKTWKEQNPDSRMEWPDAQSIGEAADKRAIDARQMSESLAARSTSWSSSLGGFAGTAAGAMRDPVNLMTLPLGATRSMGLLKTALVEGGVGMTSEAAIQAARFSEKRRLDPSFSGSDALYEVAAAGFGGAVLGSAPQAIANLWHKAKTGTWPRHVRDAANVVTREASLPKSRIGKSAGAAGAHKSALAKAADDLIQNKPVELPPDLFVKAGARPGRVYDSDGRSVGVEYQVVEADDLITSHDADLRENPAFPQELQPRDRSRAMSRDQINAIAQNLQPERLGPSPQADSGAPIVGPDGLVESGNGRVMALRQAFNQGSIPAENYRNFLRAQGFDLEGFKSPVLIARRVTELAGDERVGFVGAANRATAMRLGAAEQARADARMIDDALLERLESGEVDAAANRGFVQGFMQRLSRAEQGSLIDKTGALSVEGERRVRSALMARAYDEPAFLNRALEDADNNIKTLAGAMSDAAPKWVRMRDAVASGAVPQGMDITGDVMDALRLVMKARDEGTALRDLVNQAEMFGGLSEIGKIVARSMFNEDMTRGASRAKVTRFLADYADEAMKNTADARLFGDALEAPDVLKTALKRAEREDLMIEAEKRLTPERIEEIAASDETMDAVIMQANRLREQTLMGVRGDADDADTKFLDAIRSMGAKEIVPRDMEFSESYLAAYVISPRGRLYDILTDSNEGLAHEEFIAAMNSRGLGSDLDKTLKITGIGTELAIGSIGAKQMTKQQAAKVLRIFGAAGETPYIVHENGGYWIGKQSSSQSGVRFTLGDSAVSDVVENAEATKPAKTSPIMIDLGDGERSLDDIFDEADNEIAMANDFEACTTGGAAGGDAGSGKGPSVGDALSAPRRVTFDADGNVSGFEVDLAGARGGSVRGALNGERRMVKDASGNIIGDEPA